MSRSKYILLLTFLTASLLLAPATFVVQAHADDEAVAESTVVSEEGEEESTKPKKTLQERVAERKEKRAIKLNSAQTVRLKNRCKSAQGRINSLNENVKGIEKNRTALYDKIVVRLNELVDKIGDQADTTTLKTEITTLSEKVDDFKGHIAAYRTSLDDLAQMDCEADPEGFKASLETAKEYRAELLTISKDIRMTIKDNIKPLLQEIKKQLNPESESEEE